MASEIYTFCEHAEPDQDKPQPPFDVYIPVRLQNGTHLVLCHLCYAAVIGIILREVLSPKVRY